MLVNYSKVQWNVFLYCANKWRLSACTQAKLYRKPAATLTYTNIMTVNATRRTRFHEKSTDYIQHKNSPLLIKVNITGFNNNDYVNLHGQFHTHDNHQQISTKCLTISQWCTVNGSQSDFTKVTRRYVSHTWHLLQQYSTISMKVHRHLDPGQTPCTQCQPVTLQSSHTQTHDRNHRLMEGSQLH